MISKDDILFEVRTPVGLTVRTTKAYWDIITTQKHPAIRERLNDVMSTLESPEQVRKSKSDLSVLLFYRPFDRRWICAVVKRLNGLGFLVTAYVTNAVKNGEVVWMR